MTTLLAVTGLSPAIVTETLWALAHGNPAILPERVVMVTTTVGQQILEDQLFASRPEWNDRSVWECLRAALGAGPGQLIATPIQTIPLPDGTSGRAHALEDIRTPAENNAAAEFLFSQVWNIVRDPENRLIASIAGGRKTMGALLHAAVSLIGRETDRVTHILVEPPYDTLPGFFFPGQPESPLLSLRDSRAYDPAAARLHLADVPFVPLRNRFRELEELPASYLALRDELSDRLAREADRAVSILVDHARGVLVIDDVDYPVRRRALAILHHILVCNQEGKIPPDQTSAAEDFHARLSVNSAAFGPETFAQIDDTDYRRELNYLRDQLRRAPWQPAMRTLRQSPFRLLDSGGERAV